MVVKIREYAESVGFEVVGNITYMGKRNLSDRWYMDDARNAYIIDSVLETIRIIPARKNIQEEEKE